MLNYSRNCRLPWAQIKHLKSKHFRIIKKSKHSFQVGMIKEVKLLFLSNTVVSYLEFFYRKRELSGTDTCSKCSYFLNFLTFHFTLKLENKPWCSEFIAKQCKLHIWTKEMLILSIKVSDYQLFCALSTFVWGSISKCLLFGIHWNNCRVY